MAASRNSKDLRKRNYEGSGRSRGKDSGSLEGMSPEGKRDRRMSILEPTLSQGSSQRQGDEEGEWRAIIRFGDVSGKSVNPFSVSDELKKKCGSGLTIRSLSNGNLLVLCKDEAQRNKLIAKVKRVEDRDVECVVAGTGAGRGLQGVIYGVDVGVAEDDIVKKATGAKIVGAKRFMTVRDGVRMPSTAVLVTFEEEELPVRVQLGFMSYLVKAYERPPLRCFRCQRFGHIAAVCRGVRKCGKCGGGHDFKDCTSEEVKCGNCGGAHRTAFRGCEYHERAQRIEKVRSEGSMSYAEAARVVKEGEEARVGSGSAGRVAAAPRGVVVPAGSMIVDKGAFLAFLVEVMWAAKQLKESADVRVAVVKEAEAFLGIVVTPEQLTKHRVLAKRGGAAKAGVSGGEAKGGGGGGERGGRPEVRGRRNSVESSGEDGSVDSLRIE